MFERYKIKKLMDRLGDLIESKREFDGDNNVHMKSHSIYLKSTKDLKLGIRFTFKNIPEHVKSYYKMHNGECLSLGTYSYNTFFNIDLEKSVSENYKSFLKAYESVFNEVNTLIEEACEFFVESVDSIIDIGTPKGHYGTYYVQSNSLKVDSNTLTFTSPYTYKTHTFTKLFTYSVLHAVCYNETFNEIYEEPHDWY